VSYGYMLSERALAGLRKMELWLQEETLDELDRLTAQQPFPGRRIGELIVRDFVRERGTNRHYVFLTLFPNAPAQTLTVSNIGWCVLPQQTDT